MTFDNRFMIAEFRPAGAPVERRPPILRVAAALMLLAQPAMAELANWGTSGLDIWVYGNAPSGTRATMPSFTGGLEIDQSTGQFVPKGNRDTARHGTALLAFNTAELIETGLPAESYQIQAVTLTVGLEAAGVEPLLYRRTPVANAEILANVANGQVDTAMPFELYGVGFRSGYTGFGFGSFSAGPPLLEENNSPYSADGYVAYPIASDGGSCCNYVDVTNSLTGGFSATAPGNVTEPFDSVPWAIGESDLDPGDVVSDDDQFDFSLDLTSPAVKHYVQAGLAKGELGFFLSSLHIAGQFGSAGAYPSWYSQEAPLGGDAPPRLEIEYTIAEPLAGDFDDDGDVDGGDFLQWQRTLGAAVPQGSGADGTGDGLVGADDMALWQQGFGAPGSLTAAARAVPEPASFSLLLISTATARLVRFRRRVIAQELN